MTPAVNAIVELFPLACVFALGWMFGRDRGEDRAWKEADREVKELRDVFNARIDAMEEEKRIERGHGRQLLAAKAVVDKLLAAKQRRLRGVLSEARRWKSVAEHLGWVRPTQANVAALGAAVRETMDRENRE